MYRDYRLYIDDIIEAIRRIKEFTNRMEFDAFKADIKTQDAVVRNLEITQSQMAELLGISQNYLSLIEQNKRVPSNESLKTFASSLKISEDALKFVASEVPAELDDKDSFDFQRLQKNILSLMIFQSSGELKICA